VGTIVVGLTFLMAACADAQPSAAGERAVPSLTVAQMRADIAAFRTEILERDRSYAPEARAEANARLARLDEALGRTTRVAFELELARIVALADNGHTIAFPNTRSTHFNRVAIRLTPIGADFRVLRAPTSASDLLGARLVAIDGHAVAELRAAGRTLAGGVPARRDQMATFLLESPEQLQALGLSKNADRATYAFETMAGKTIERQLVAEAPRPDGGFPPGSDRWLSPEPVAGESLTSLLTVGRSPWALAEVSTAFRVRTDADLRALVMQMRRVSDAPGHPIAAFLAEVTQRIQTEHPENIVIDMRFNGGGNLQTTRDFMQGLPSLVPGRIFVLTSPWTFSAAISSVGYLKQAAPARVTIVGEDVGDRLNFFAEGGPVFLPNSGVGVSIATQRHDYQTGCVGFSDCHGPVVRYPIAVPTLAPAIAAPWTIEAYAVGRDPGLEAVAVALRR
jgi:hypothetical protein